MILVVMSSVSTAVTTSLFSLTVSSSTTFLASSILLLRSIHDGCNEMFDNVTIGLLFLLLCSPGLSLDLFSDLPFGGLVEREVIIDCFERMGCTIGPNMVISTRVYSKSPLCLMKSSKSSSPRRTWYLRS